LNLRWMCGGGDGDLRSASDGPIRPSVAAVKASSISATVVRGGLFRPGGFGSQSGKVRLGRGRFPSSHGNTAFTLVTSGLGSEAITAAYCPSRSRWLGILFNSGALKKSSGRGSRYGRGSGYWWGSST